MNTTSQAITLNLPCFHCQAQGRFTHHVGSQNDPSYSALVYCISCHGTGRMFP
ncbi:MAG: hypothetical protein ACRYFS_24460 [Janthinobacterium lividum]